METGVYEVRKHGQAMSRIEKEVWPARKTSSHHEFVFRAGQTSFSMGRTPPRNTKQEGSAKAVSDPIMLENLPASYSWLLRARIPSIPPTRRRAPRPVQPVHPFLSPPPLISFSPPIAIPPTPCYNRIISNHTTSPSNLYFINLPPPPTRILLQISHLKTMQDMSTTVPA